ncbi:hypothetical protein ES708_05015 [subsurface metagenome]
MKIEEFKNSEPDLYSEIIAKERDRVKAWLVFIDVDKDKVVKAIKDGTDFTPTGVMIPTLEAQKKLDAFDKELDEIIDVKKFL